MNDYIAKRREAAHAAPAAVPCGTGRSQPFAAQIRSQTVERNGKQLRQLDGYASTVEQSYEMYDFFGPYDEVIDAGAFDATLSREPDVAFLLNHRGVTMARTKNGTLELSADETGLFSRAFVNPERSDVADMLTAIDDGDITEMSFAFVIKRGQWSPDYTEYRILEVDLDRGDVSAVNYGANPHTSIMARQRELFTELDGLEGAALRAAQERLASRLEPAQAEKPQPKRMSLALAHALAEIG